MDIIEQLGPAVQGVGLGNTATVDLPIGPTYHSILILATGTATAGNKIGRDDMLGLINVNINGKTQRAFLAIEADIIHTAYKVDYAAPAYNSTGAGNTLLPVYSAGQPQAPQIAAQTTVAFRIFFAEPWRKSYAAREYRKLPTAYKDGSTFKSFQLTIQIPNTGNAAASGLSYLIYTETDQSIGALDAKGNPLANMVKWYRNQVPYNAAGDNQLTNLYKQSGNRAFFLEQQTFFCQAGDDIQRVQVWADSRLIRDSTAFTNNIRLLGNDYNPLLWNADVFHLDYDYSDNPSNSLVLSTGSGLTVLNHKITFTLGAAAAGNKVINHIGQVWGPVD